MSLLLFAAALGALPLVQDVSLVVPTGSFDVPPEIAPAVVPYMNCLADASSAEARERGNVPIAEWSAHHVRVRERCGSARQKASGEAVDILARRNQGSETDRATKVERTLQSIEAAFSAVPNIPPTPRTGN